MNGMGKVRIISFSVASGKGSTIHFCVSNVGEVVFEDQTSEEAFREAIRIPGVEQLVEEVKRSIWELNSHLIKEQESVQLDLPLTQESALRTE
ncbi:MAG: hypothetical protein WC705_02685 [Candidatus Paceibacterota bacterium]|jgi:hypothetical protein